MNKKLWTVWVFTRISTRRFFRDRLAMFFSIAFPLIFLLVFGSINSSNTEVSFNVAVINKSDSKFAEEFVKDAKKDDSVLKVDKEVSTLEAAKEKMNRGELDATLVLPESFGEIKQESDQHPSGKVEVIYTQNNEQAGQTLASILDAQFTEINKEFVNTNMPFTVETNKTNDKSLSTFDYTFAGLLGFAIIGMGIFGPVNVFPELKKMGILRRLHTTPLRVWQYFLSTMLSQLLIGAISLALMFGVAIALFNLNVVGNYLELTAFLILSVISILGIGLALGGWAKNERQVAPLANIIVFPMMFLSGTFFPRFLMPDWLQTVSAFLPLTPVIDGVRLLATEGQHLMDILPQIGMVAAWTVVIYLIAFKVFRWE